MANPVNTVAPLLSGTKEVGSTLFVTNGTWTGGPQSFTYQWQKTNGQSQIWSNILSATNATYLIQSIEIGFKLRCQVTASNNSGSTLALSDETIPISLDWFVAEDGTGIENANSLIGLDFSDKYHSLRNNTEWSNLLVGQKKSAMVKASDYMTAVYRSKWKGTRVNGTQALDWPRSFVERDDYEYQGLNGFTMIGGNFYFRSNEVPKEVKEACAELALKAAKFELAPDISQAKKGVKIGPLQVEYNENMPAYKRYRNVDNLLSPFLKQVPGGVFRRVEV